ncbi:MAG: cysteine-rich CWC family protein [Bacteroidales bacterium]|nr:cysteine-rich CWC family protein [Bacteroidales bacterium]MBK9356094.1 cysteine-rich CWC family protein [Bacteroidales bacterium]
MNESVKPTQKICPRCGRTFGCLHAEGCWCFDFVITPENTEKLKNTYNNCLCPECLPLYGEKKTTGNV